MANKTNLSSWGNLRNYLATNVDPAKDWDNEEIKDYSALLGAQAAGKVSGDKFTEGRNLFQHYLADAQATDTYQKAQAQAENEARRETAYGNYLNTRLASYLREIQGNAGIAGYAGLTQGQAIAVKNDQENAFRAIQDNKRTALQGALDTYQGALASHSQTAIDQATAIDAARDSKDEAKASALETKLRDFVDEYGLVEENGKVSKDNYNRIRQYIESADISEEKKKSLLDEYAFQAGVLTQTYNDATKEAVKTTVDTSKITNKNYSDTMNYLEENKEALGEDYNNLANEVNIKMNESTHTLGEGYSLVKSDPTFTGWAGAKKNGTFDIQINGRTFKLEGEYAGTMYADIVKTLNALNTEKRTGKIVEYNGEMYLCFNSNATLGSGGWAKLVDGTDKMSDFVAAWKEYENKIVSSPVSSGALSEYFAAAETNGADVKTAYKAGGSSRDILRNVKISAYGNKTFGEIMDAIDNSKEMTNTEKGRRRTSAYNQLAEEVKKQNIKY